jgi:hypothetical protein
MDLAENDERGGKRGEAEGQVLWKTPVLLYRWKNPTRQK